MKDELRRRVLSCAPPRRLRCSTASVNREIETRKSIVWLNKTTYESFKKATLLSRAVMLPLPSVAMPLMSNGQWVRLIVFPYAGRHSGIEQVAQFYSQFAQTEES